MRRLLQRVSRRSPSTTVPTAKYQDLTSLDHLNGYRNSVRSADNVTVPALARELFDDLLQLGRQPTNP